MTTPAKLRAWYEAGWVSFMARLKAVGFAAGLASWLLLHGLHRVAGTPAPSTLELVVACLMGTIFGATLALGLSWYWGRHSGRRGQ